MRAFIAAIAVSLVMAFGAYAILDGVQKPADAAFSTTGTRL
jgi:hypothetical protein